MNIIDKLKSFGVEVTGEMEKVFSGEWVSDLEIKKKTEKITELETKNKELVSKQENLEKDLQTLKDSTPDADAMNQKIADLTATLEKERNERKQKDEETRLAGLVTDFFQDNWVNVREIGGHMATTLIESQSVDLTGGYIATAKCRGYSVVTKDPAYTGEIYAGERGLI